MGVKDLLEKYNRPRFDPGEKLDGDTVEVPAGGPARGEVGQKTEPAAEAPVDEGFSFGRVQIYVDHHARFSVALMPESWLEALQAAFVFINPAWRKRQQYAAALEPPAKYLYAWFFDDADRLCVPAASLRWLVDFFHKRKVHVEIADHTRSDHFGKAVSFAGDLAEVSVAEAFRALIEKRYGIFRASGDSAYPVACAVMASRGERTLIVVKRKRQLYRWKDEILRNTDLSDGDIGLVGDRHCTVDAPVVVGIDRSLYKVFADIRAGQLIVDRCDIANPKIFYSLCGAAPWRYILGVSAVDRREDGLDKMMRSFCGPVRYRMGKIGGRQHRPVLSVFDSYAAYDRENDDYMALVSQMVGNSLRTRQIAGDILQYLASGLRVLVVSSRTGHLEAIGEMLADQFWSFDILTGRTGDSAKQAMEQRFGRPEAGVLMTTTKSVGDIDAPAADVAVVAAPFRYRDTAAGMVSRIKDNGRLVEYRDLHPFFEASLKKRIRVYKELNVDCRAG